MPGNFNNLYAVILAGNRGGRNDLRQNFWIFARERKRIRAPAFAFHIKHLRGGGDCLICIFCAAKRICKKIRHKQHQLCIVIILCHKLKKRVYGHNLISRGCIKLFGRYFFICLIGHIFCAGIAVIGRQAHNFACAVYKPVIHTPGIKSQGIRLAANFASLFDSFFYFGKQIRKIPAQFAAAIHGAVFKSVYFFIFKATGSGIIFRKNCPAARSAEIKSKHLAH